MQTSSATSLPQLEIIPLTRLDGHEGPVLQVSFSPDGKYLASSGGDGTVKVWSVPDGDLVATLSDQIGWVLIG